MRQEMSFGQYQRQDQVQIMAPRMIQSMEILQLATMALEERIQKELEENPFLEVREVADEPVADTDFNADDAPTAEEPRDYDSKELVIESEGSNAEDFDRLQEFATTHTTQFDEEHRPSRSGMDEEGDRKHDAMQNMASRPQSLQDYLADQLAYLDVTPAQNKLMRHLITHIADTGYLGFLDEKDRFYPYTLDDVASTYKEPVTLEQLEEALHLVQKLDPPGVGARDLRECLLLQLTPETPYRELLRPLIQNHLEDIEHNRLPAIQRRTGFELQDIKTAIEQLKRLNPRPGAQFIEEHIPYVVPDILVERSEESGEYTVKLLDDWLPNIYVSRRYIDLIRDKSISQETRELLKRKIQAAQWLKESIEQRRNTLERVTKAIIKRQKAFLDKGPEHIEPLKMQQIADEVHVHVTTVSRAVDDKWVQTPRGIFPLKRFFGGGTHNTTTGEDVAYETIRQKMLEVIEQEDKSNPLSDEDLMQRLQEAGYPVARRTVTKYRKMANIQSSRQRKDWTA